MNDKDKAVFIRRYRARYQQHGYSPVSLGWGKGGRQHLRFSVLAGIGIGKEDSVLDIGCGFGDLFGYLKSTGWKGRYLGVDIVDALLLEARRQYSGIRVKNSDILKDRIAGSFDYVVASGVFNAKLKHEGGAYVYIFRMLKKMFGLCRKGVAVDFMSSYVDFKHPIAFHADPARMLKLAKRISRRVALRHDYMPYEFAVYIHKKDEIRKDVNTFKDFISCHNQGTA